MKIKHNSVFFSLILRENCYHFPVCVVFEKVHTSEFTLYTKCINLVRLRFHLNRNLPQEEISHYTFLSDHEFVKRFNNVQVNLALNYKRNLKFYTHTVV